MQREGKHVLSHAAIYLVARGLPGIMAFLSIPLFTRLLDPADYGRYALVIATVSLLNALVFQWLRLSLVRYLPAYRDDLPALKSTLVTVMLILIVALGIAAAIFCLLPMARGWRGVIGAGWVLLTIQAFYELCCEYSRAAVQPWRYMGLQLLRSSVILALGAALVLLGAAWRGPVAATAAGMALAVAWVWRRYWAGVKLGLDRAILSKLCQYGIPLSLTVALTIMISSSDRFLIAWFRGEDAAGLYSVAVDFTSQTLFLLMMVVNLAVFPIAVRAFEHHGKEAAQEQMRTNAALLMAIGVPCVVGLTILAPGIANCFLGKNFREAAAGIIPLIALGTFLAGLKAYHFDAAFQFAHRTVYQVWIVLFAAALNVALNLVVVPRYGINGAAVVSVLAYLVSIALTAWLGRRHFVLPFPAGPCGRVLLAGAAMALLLWPLRNYAGPWAGAPGYRAPLVLTVQIGLGAVVYAAILVALNFLELRELLSARLARWRLAMAVPSKISVVHEKAVAEGIAVTMVKAQSS